MNVHDTQINDLLQTNESGLKLSIFQPTHQAGNGQTIQEDATRFKNALQTIRAGAAYDESELGETMSTLDALQADMEFWKHRTVGLAVFADKHGYNAIDMWVDVTEAQYIDEKYFVSPLVLEGSLGLKYYILDVNHTRPRLLEADTKTCTELVLPGMPDSFDEMTENVEYKNELQHQSGGVSAYHGHSDESAVHDDTMRYYRKVAKAVEEYLVDHTEPVVLVGVQNRVGNMRQTLSYAHVLEDYFEGSGEAMAEQRIHEVTLPILQKYNTQQRGAVIDSFTEADPKMVLSGVESISEAANEGRVQKLLLPAFRKTTDTVRDGFEPEIILQIDSEDFETEELVRAVLAQGGEVVAIDVVSFEDGRPRAFCRY